MKPLYVVKVGSATLDREAIFDELAGLVAGGARVLLVAGGAVGIKRHYAAMGREMPQLRMANGDIVRHCPPAEMPHLVDAYEKVVLPAVEAGLRRHAVAVFSTAACRGGLVTGKVNRPLRVLTTPGRTCVVRDHRAGVPDEVDTTRLTALLDAFDVVCLSPPIADREGGSPLNLDADALAAALSNALGADHLRLVTGTPGLLTDPADPGSTLRHAYPGEAGRYARGRMRQKVRAAESAMAGSADIAIAGPHTLAEPDRWTRFWRAPAPAEDLSLMGHAVAVPSVSGDERELTAYLLDWCVGQGITATVDAAGNLVAFKGDGPRQLLMLGHLDTVPFHWPVSWKDGELSGRGSVDAKSSLVSFLEVLAAADVPAGGQLRVVGAVEEEVSSSKGAFHVRDHYSADAVIIGEPSGSTTLTLGYWGLFKIAVTVVTPSGHSAARDAVSAPDSLYQTLSDIRTAVEKHAPEALSALIDIECEAGRAAHRATGVLCFRVPPGADLDSLREAAVAHSGPAVRIEILRATPGCAVGRSIPLVKAFNRAFGNAGIRPRYVVKKGTSDMNTLATRWHGVPMVAYGPGDSALDHTEAERIGADEYRRARAVLSDAVSQWFALAEGRSA